MGFDVNSQGNSATVNLPASGSNPSVPPKPSMTSASSTDASRKPATAASSVSSTPMSSGSGGYSLYSLIKKQSQSTPAVQRPAVSNMKLSATSPAKSMTTSTSSQPAGLLKKPSGLAGVTAEKPSTDSAVTGSRNAVSFANPVEKAEPVDKKESAQPQRFVIFSSSLSPFAVLRVGSRNGMYTACQKRSTYVLPITLLCVNRFVNFCRQMLQEICKKRLGSLPT